MANVACLLLDTATTVNCVANTRTNTAGVTVRSDSSDNESVSAGCCTEILLRRLLKHPNITAGLCTQPIHSTSLVESISADQLAQLLSTTSSVVVLVDCRTFISYNTNHITGAFNAACGDRFSRKRLQDRRATIADLVSGGPGADRDGGAKESYRQLVDRAQLEKGSMFVAYDDNTRDITSLPATHPLRVLTDSLRNSPINTKFLQGNVHNAHIYIVVKVSPHHLRFVHNIERLLLTPSE